MDECCDHKGEELSALRHRQAYVLHIVLWLNLIMFGVEAVYGLLAHSTSLLADSLDMLGDATVYGFSLYVLHRGPRWKASAALIKGVIMAFFGVAILIEAGMKFYSHTLPTAETMGWVAFSALAVNATSALLLFRHRGDDLNMRSTWICSRNDMLSNIGILIAAALVYLLGKNWPDIVVGGVIAVLVLTSSFTILSESWRELQKTRTPS
jgi:cation diffusion facilitator family transporter